MFDKSSLVASAATARLISVFKFVAIVASAFEALTTSSAKAKDPTEEFASTYVLTAFTLGYLVSEPESIATLVLLFVKSSFKSSACCVRILIGLLLSLVLSTLSSPKLIKAPSTVVAFVPPFSIETTPVTFSALTADKAKGTDENN